ncbi:VWA domain-containing protein [Myxococcus eversor]|uniref:VWA domain-containing protein n=1 Tax=Myxococcus eversor TaxID=2709661 RepID=UPI0013D71F01|nr:VWA domain-containing protein [Myxococcus eversor]
MNRTLKQMLWCALVMPAFIACGPDLGTEQSSTPLPEESRQAISLVADPRVNDDVSRDGPRTPTRLIQAEHSFAGPEVQGLGPNRYGLVLMDRSGSLTTVRASTGNSRCYDSRKQALLELDRLFDPNDLDRTHVAVWSFAGTVVTKHTVNYVDYATAKAAIEALPAEGCSGVTPLADAMCWAIDNLSTQDPGFTTNLYIATDGEENSSTGECSGPNGTVGNLASWHGKVYTKANASLVKTSTSYWVSSTDLELWPGQFESLASAAATCTTAAPWICDDQLFSALATRSGGEYRRANDANAAYPCARATSCPVPYAGTRGNTLPFRVSGTNNATVNTANQAIYLRAGETLTVGTCGVAGASAVGDTNMKLFGPGGTQVAQNDDSCGLLSKITFTALTTGTYQVRVGCFANNPCNGTAAYTIAGAFNFTATKTQNATVNTFNRSIYLRPGQRLQLGTCGVAGASGVGDTLVRLFGPTTPSTQVAFNDDACGGSLSNFTYAVPDTGAGESEIRVGCYATTSCNGSVGYVITDAAVP